MDDNEKCVYLKENNKSVQHTKCEFFYYWHKDEWWLNNIHAFLSPLVLAVLHVALTRLTHKWRKKVNKTLSHSIISLRASLFSARCLLREVIKSHKAHGDKLDALKSRIMTTTIYTEIYENIFNAIQDEKYERFLFAYLEFLGESWRCARISMYIASEASGNAK